MAKRLYKRWLGIGGRVGRSNPMQATVSECIKRGIECNGHKRGWCAWYSMVFRATPEEMADLAKWWGEHDIDWFNRQPRGAWPVPDEPLSLDEMRAAESEAPRA